MKKLKLCWDLSIYMYMFHNAHSCVVIDMYIYMYIHVYTCVYLYIPSGGKWSK